MMNNKITEKDRYYLQQCIELAHKAARSGNLPIGALVSLDDEVIARGKNSIWVPKFNGIRHAEIEALLDVPSELWTRSREMTLYTTLEPCLMCLGALLLHGIGRIVYGASDDYDGSECVIGHLPEYFKTELLSSQWIGPALPEECDELCAKVRSLEAERNEFK